MPVWNPSNEAAVVPPCLTAMEIWESKDRQVTRLPEAPVAGSGLQGGLVEICQQGNQRTS